MFKGKRKKELLKELHATDWTKPPNECPDCRAKRDDPQMTVCFECDCFLLAGPLQGFVQKTKNEFGFLARAEIDMERNKVEDGLVATLKTRKRQLQRWQETSKITKEQIHELDRIDDQIQKVELGDGAIGEFFEGLSKIGDIPSDGDIIDPEKKATLGKAWQQYGEDLDTGKEKGAYHRFMGTLLSDDGETEAEEKTEAEKITQRTEEQMAAHKAQRKAIDDEIDEREKEKLELERSIGKLEKMPADSDIEELLQLKRSKLERLNDDIIGLKQKRKRMAG